MIKMSERLVELDPILEWAPNIHGRQGREGEYLHRIDDLRSTRAKIKFISFEPLPGPVGKLDLGSIDLAIVETSPGPGRYKISK